MRASEVWRRIFGWQVGDFLKYYYVPSWATKGRWLTLRVIEIAQNDDFLKVETLNDPWGKIDTFYLRITWVEQKFPEHLRSYTPRRSTVEKLDKARV